MKKFFYRLTALLLTLSLSVLPASALTVDQALELLEKHYLRDIPEAAYQAETLDELFASLGDPYTYYMSAEEYQSFLGAVEGDQELVGVGVSVQYTEQGILVVDLVDGGSAQEEGLLPGDLIIAVDGVSCVPASERHRDLLTGEPDTQVTVTVLRGGQTLSCTLIRRPLVIPNTRLEILGGHIGHFDCDTFGSDTGNYFADEVSAALEQEGLDLWQVDLRDNGGGYANTAVDSLGVFAGYGYQLYLLNGRDTTSGYIYLQDASTHCPVIVLVNGNTASAAEAFAAGVRDRKLGVTVGSRTFGKGVAQIVCDETNTEGYFDGDAVKITAYRFYTGLGNTTDQVGVIPTLLVDDAAAPGVAAALSGVQDGPAEGRVMLTLAGFAFFLDPEQASPEAMSALFSALPPSAALYLGTGEDDWMRFSAQEIAAKLGFSFERRWFSDLLSSPYRDEINTLGTYGLLKGDGDGTFRPAEQLTRAEFCVMLARLLNLSDPGGSRFSDVPDGAWYAGAVHALAAQGLVQGMGDGTFQPQGTLTQEQFMLLMARLARYLNFAVDSYGAALAPEAMAASETLSVFPAGETRESAALLSEAAQATMGTQEDLLYTSLDHIDLHAPVLREEAAAGLYTILAVLGYIPA